ncbi:MAG: oligosaccharide flippase family protein [Clostridia bacterium]|nr:oligosaccharide flippase family protein [Clostridia bacterium]
MSDKMRFFRSGILLTLVGLAMRTVSMFFGAFISRTVGAEGTGLFTLVTTVYSFAVTFATSGISLTVTRLVASALGEGKPGEVGRVLRGSLLYSSLFGVLATLFLFFGADFLGTRVLSDERTVTSLKVLAFSLVPTALGSVFSGYFVGVKRVGFNAAVSVFCQFIKIALTVVLVTNMAQGGIVSAVVGLCIGITLTEMLGFVLIFLEFLFDRHRHFARAGKQSPEIPSVAKMALPLAFSAYVRSLLLNVEHILIPKKLREHGESTSEAYSHYGVLHGMALPMIIYPMSPLSSFAGLLVPEFAEDLAAGRVTRMQRIATKALNTTLSYATICSVFLFTFAEELGYVVYNSYDAGYYISTLAFIVPIMYLDHVADSMLKGIGEQVFSMWVNITDSLLSVILVWLLIPRLGIMGYAIVIVVMEAYNFTLSILRLRKRVSFSISPLPSIALPLIVSLIVTLVTRNLFRFGGSSVSGVWIFLKMLFSASLTVAVIAILKIDKRDIKKAIKAK